LNSSFGEIRVRTSDMGALTGPAATMSSANTLPTTCMDLRFVIAHPLTAGARLSNRAPRLVPRPQSR
jgi:hypothetical protein